MTGLIPRRARLLTLVMACALAAAAAVVMPGHAVAAGGPAFQRTEVITRDMLVDGVTNTVDTRVFSLSVSKTQNLHGLEVLDVSWVGAHPTQNIAPDPNDLNNATPASAQEYPVVLMQCRGVDSPDAPPDQRLDPTTCWRASPREYYYGTSGAFPGWRLDLYGPPAQRAAVFGEPANACQTAGAPARHWVPFNAVNGASYPGGNSGCAGMPPEAGQSLGEQAFPSNETYAVSGGDGRGSAKFYVLNADDNASLGCSQTQACSLVVVPIMGMSCDVAGAGLPPEDQVPTATAADAEALCSTPGTPAGSNGLDDTAVQGSMWWAASNWRNRVTVPLTFARVGDPCTVTGANGEVAIYGSELMAEATSQWDPRFCLDSSLFTLKHVQTPEPEARNLLAEGIGHPGGVEAAYSAYAPTGTYSSPVVNAPVALTGFAIAFQISDRNNSEVKSLNLTPRLLAKLLTESYTVNGFIPTATMAGNSEEMSLDPEFTTLNPGLPATGAQSAAVLEALSSDSDVMYALTSYIYNDPEARSWLDGHPDPWGMVVNPHYRTSSKEVSLPTQSWPLLDTATNTALYAASPGPCLPYAVTPYFDILAAPSPTLQQLSLSMEFSQPLSTTDCSGTPPDVPYALKRVSREPPNGRFMLGVVSLAEARRLELDTASLQTQVAPGSPAKFASAAGRTFVAPTDQSLRAAAGLLAPDSQTQTFQIPSGAIRNSPTGAAAYPGTMLVNAEIPTQGIDPTDANRYAQFLRFAAGDGQTPGTEVGQLPAGYLPMTPANGMGAEAAYSRLAADAVAAQDGTVPPVDPNAPPSPSPTASSNSPAPTSSQGASGGNSPSPSPGTPSGTATDAPSSPGGAASTLGLGPLLGNTHGGGGTAKAPVPAPAVLGPIGKTIAVIAHIASSLVRWLLYLALAAMAAAAGLYLVARRQGVSLAGMRERLLSVVGRRRSPR